MGDLEDPTADTHEALPWLAKVGAVPTLPRPTDKWREQLVRLLTFLQSAGPLPRDTVFQNPGSETQYTLGQYTDQLAPFEIVARSGDKQVDIGRFGATWLKDPTADGLLRQLHSRARLVGELLAALDGGTMTMAELSDLANEEYGLDWKSRDQVRRRLTWLISLGFAERFYNNHYAITDAGRAILPSLTLHSPGTGAEESSASLPVSGPAITAAIATLAADDARNRERHRGLGYIPANAESPLEGSIRTLTMAGLSEVSADTFIADAVARFRVSESSARAALKSLLAVGLFEPTGRATSIVSPMAREWLDSGESVDLLRILHVSTFPVGEVIELIDEAKRAPALAIALDHRYGDGATSSLATGRILPLLLAGDMIREVGYARYASTARGRAFAASLPLRKSSDEAHEAAIHEPDQLPDGDEIARELEDAGTRSDQPRRLETAVAEAMRYLGAVAEVISGPGDTDVLVELGTQPADKVVAIIDAKSSGQGTVSENAVKLDAIEDHKKKNGATLAAIVGPGFGGRLATWAEEKHIALITTEFLASLVREHTTNPLGRPELVRIFDGPKGQAALRDALAARSQESGLVGVVMAVLLREAMEDDPNVVAGLDIDGIYRAIRDQYAIKADKEALRAAVGFLTSPLVGGLVKEGASYIAVEPLDTVKRRIAALSESLNSASRGD
jgi:hypothetical protein